MNVIKPNKNDYPFGVYMMNNDRIKFLSTLSKICDVYNEKSYNEWFFVIKKDGKIKKDIAKIFNLLINLRSIPTLRELVTNKTKSVIYIIWAENYSYFKDNYDLIRKIAFLGRQLKILLVIACPNNIPPEIRIDQPKLFNTTKFENLFKKE